MFKKNVHFTPLEKLKTPLKKSNFWNSLMGFIKYHNAFAIGLSLFFLFFMSSSATFATNVATGGKVINKAEDTQQKIDNSALLAADLDKFNLEMKIISMSEDSQKYYLKYSYQTFKVVNNVWQPIRLTRLLKVYKSTLGKKDLKLYAADQLSQVVQSQLSYLKKVQAKEKGEGQVEKTVTENIAKTKTKIQDQINSLITKTKKDQQTINQANTLDEVKNYLNIISGGNLTDSSITLADLQNQIDAQATQTIKALQDQITALENQNQTILAFANALGVQENGINLLGGKLTTGGVVAGAFTVKVADPDKKTIGQAEICPANQLYDNSTETCINSNDTSADGTSITIQTKAVDNNSHIFVTSQTLTNEPLAVTEIKSCESFKVQVKNSVSKPIKFNWWIVEKSSQTTKSSSSSNSETNPETAPTAPKITLLGSPEININKSEQFIDVGVKATNSAGEDITDKVVVNNPVSINAIGDYQITYNVSDKNGEAKEVTRTVKVNEVDKTRRGYSYVNPKDDNNDGISYLVKTPAVTDTTDISEIFINASVANQVEKVKNEDGKYIGFKVILDKETTEKVYFNWWIVESR